MTTIGSNPNQGNYDPSIVSTSSESSSRSNSASPNPPSLTDFEEVPLPPPPPGWPEELVRKKSEIPQDGLKPIAVPEEAVPEEAVSQKAVSQEADLQAIPSPPPELQTMDDVDLRCYLAEECLRNNDYLGAEANLLCITRAPEDLDDTLNSRIEALRSKIDSPRSESISKHLHNLVESEETSIKTLLEDNKSHWDNKFAGLDQTQLAALKDKFSAAKEMLAELNDPNTKALQSDVSNFLADLDKTTKTIQQETLKRLGHRPSPKIEEKLQSPETKWDTSDLPELKELLEGVSDDLSNATDSLETIKGQTSITNQAASHPHSPENWASPKNLKLAEANKAELTMLHKTLAEAIEQAKVAPGPGEVYVEQWEKKFHAEAVLKAKQAKVLNADAARMEVIGKKMAILSRLSNKMAIVSGQTKKYNLFTELDTLIDTNSVRGFAKFKLQCRKAALAVGMGFAVLADIAVYPLTLGFISFSRSLGNFIKGRHNREAAIIRKLENYSVNVDTSGQSLFKRMHSDAAFKDMLRDAVALMYKPELQEITHIAEDRAKGMDTSERFAAFKVKKSVRDDCKSLTYQDNITTAEKQAIVQRLLSVLKPQSLEPETVQTSLESALIAIGGFTIDENISSRGLKAIKANFLNMLQICDSLLNVDDASANADKTSLKALVIALKTKLEQSGKLSFEEADNLRKEINKVLIQAIKVYGQDIEVALQNVKGNAAKARLTNIKEALARVEENFGLATDVTPKARLDALTSQIEVREQKIRELKDDSSSAKSKLRRSGDELRADFQQAQKMEIITVQSTSEASDSETAQKVKAAVQKFTSDAIAKYTANVGAVLDGIRGKVSGDRLNDIREYLSKKITNFDAENKLDPAQKQKKLNSRISQLEHKILAVKRDLYTEQNRLKVQQLAKFDEEIRGLMMMRGRITEK